jgi:hypothetical protein
MGGCVAEGAGGGVWVGGRSVGNKAVLVAGGRVAGGGGVGVAAGPGSTAFSLAVPGSPLLVPGTASVVSG